MRKRIIISLLIVSIMLLSLIGCSSEKMEIEDYIWNFTTMQSYEDNGYITAYSPTYASYVVDTYPDAKSVELTCTAKNGKFNLNDSNGKALAEGTYKISDDSNETIIYEIVFDGKDGTAVISNTKYENGKAIPTLILSTESYSLSFQTE